MLKQISYELKQHAPFTFFGALTGMAIMILLYQAQAPRSLTHGLFWSLHPLHVLLSALATTSMYRLKGGGSLLSAILVGYIGSIGIATLSDSLIPFFGEWMLDLPDRGIHLGFIEKWWLVHPMAAVGIAIGCFRPRTALPHAGHVLLSTWASLFHMTLAMGHELSLVVGVSIGLFLFLAVWIPCCTSDIAFPLLFVRRERSDSSS
jgi:hypothetical protein